MNLADFRQQIRAELAACDPDLANDPIEVDQQVREVIGILVGGAKYQFAEAARKAEAAADPRHRELWSRRSERLRQSIVAFEAVLIELGAGPDPPMEGPSPI